MLSSFAPGAKMFRRVRVFLAVGQLLPTFGVGKRKLLSLWMIAVPAFVARFSLRQALVLALLSLTAAAT